MMKNGVYFIRIATSTPLELSKYANFTKPVFLSFSQSLNKFLDGGASLSRPVRFDLFPI